MEDAADVSHETDFRFVHEALEDAENQIRLLKIDFFDDGLVTLLTGSLIHFPLGNAPPYEAISYVWGDQTNLRLIRLGEKPFEIGQNCHTALEQALIHRTCDFIWIDAICINQDDNAEKGKQVSMMAAIYQRARRVLASVLGFETNGPIIGNYLAPHCRALESMADDTSTAEYLKAFPLNARLKMLHSLMALGQARYWGRLWTAPERLFGQNLQCLVAAHQLDYKSLKSLIEDTQIWTNRKRPLAHRPRYRMSSTIRITPMGENMFSPNHSLRDSNICELIQHYSKRQCKHPRDRVYALLPLIDKTYSLAFVPNYDMTDEEAALQVLDCYGGDICQNDPWNRLHILIQAFQLSHGRSHRRKLALASASTNRICIPAPKAEVFRLDEERFGMLDLSAWNGSVFLPRHAQESWCSFPVAWRQVQLRFDIRLAMLWAASCKDASVGDFVAVLFRAQLQSPAIVLRHQKGSTFRIVGMAIVSNDVHSSVGTRSFSPCDLDFHYHPGALLMIAQETAPGRTLADFTGVLRLAIGIPELFSYVNSPELTARMSEDNLRSQAEGAHCPRFRSLSTFRSPGARLRHQPVRLREEWRREAEDDQGGNWLDAREPPYSEPYSERIVEDPIIPRSDEGISKRVRDYRERVIRRSYLYRSILPRSE